MGARRWRSTAVVATVVAGVVGGTVGWAETSGPGGPGAGAPPPRAAGRPEPARLVSYTDCAQMLDQLRSQAAAEVGPYGLAGSYGGYGGYGGTAATGPMMAAPAAAGAPAAGRTSAAGLTAGSATSAAPSASPSFSTTNDQEQGVDEPDLAKTDGSLLVTVEQTTDTLEVASVGAPAHLAGSLALGPVARATGLLLVGSDAVVLGAAVSGPGTEAVVVDLSDPTHPVVARSFDIQGDYVDARLIGGHVEVVVRSTPQLPFVTPSEGSPAALSAATAQNRAVVLASGPSSWLPSVTSEPSGTTTVAPCAAAMHTVSSSSSGLDTVGVVPIDPASDQPGTEVTVVGDATTVYASASALYVATSTAGQPVAVPEPAASGPAQPAPGPLTVPAPAEPAPDTTTIDAFDLSDPSAPRYVGSGQVPGTLIGQYALSEYQGDLRVATTVGSATPPPGEGTAPVTASDSRVTVLARQGGGLAPVGAVSGLGAGEKIYAVRFVGPLAYVVTFRQTDPLYVVDLSDPTAPQLAGQLPLTGYSSFLQPLGGGLVLGVGQSVDANLRTDGLQVSLFDVTDPAHPALVARDVLSGATSTAQDDPHALLYWGPTGTVVMPVSQTGVGPAGTPTDPGATVGTPFTGAVVWHVGAGTLDEVGRVRQPTTAPSAPPTGAPGAVPGLPTCTACAGTGGGGAVAIMVPFGASQGAVERALVVGDRLYTVSEAGILESDLASLAPGTWMAFS